MALIKTSFLKYVSAHQSQAILTKRILLQAQKQWNPKNKTKSPKQTRKKKHDVIIEVFLQKDQTSNVYF